MTTLDRLTEWKQAGTITDSQYETIASIVRKERFSVFLELNALLYIGVLSLAAGLGWTFKEYFANLGDAFILSTLSVMLCGSLYYCFSRGMPYSHAEVESPNFVVDYILYLACLVLAVEIGYIEFRFQILRSAWDSYLLFSAIVFFFLAYRFDNRFVLSLALSSLAGWFGLRVSRFGFQASDYLRVSAFIYGAFITATGACFHRLGIKKHFFETYLHLATNVILFAALSAVTGRSEEILYLLLLLLLSGVAVALGFWFKRFPFVVYGVGYGYVGISFEILRSLRAETAILSYFVVTGTIVIVTIAMLARRFGREE